MCGDRNWIDPRPVLRELRTYPAGTVVIHGAARGADTLAARAAYQLGFDVRAYPADWERYGRSAGPRRNAIMLREGKPDAVLAFHADIDKSRGTKHMVALARVAGLPVTIVRQ